MNPYRKDFPFFDQEKPDIYLDNAATTQKLRTVLDAMCNFYAYQNAPVHRGIYAAAEQATAQYENIRQQVAHSMNARSSSEIVFTKGTTESINMVAASYAMHHVGAGDTIVVTELEHHSNILPWQYVAQTKGAQVRYIPMMSDITLDITKIDSIITERTKLVALSLHSNIVGPIDYAAIKIIIDRAYAVGAKVLLDAAQAAAHIRIDVQALDCDFLAFSGHKVFGPTGIGVLYIRQSLHELLVPYQLGGGMAHDVMLQHATWRPMPQMLEAGTPPIAQVIGLGVALQYMKELDFAQVMQQQAQLTARLLDGLHRCNGIVILGNEELLRNSGHMVTFYTHDIHAHDIAAYAATHHMSVRAGNHCCQPLHKKLGITNSVRASLALYTTVDEIDAFVQCIDAITRSAIF